MNAMRIFEFCKEFCGKRERALKATRRVRFSHACCAIAQAEDSEELRISFRVASLADCVLITSNAYDMVN
jgi:hypothetical protein